MGLERSLKVTSCWNCPLQGVLDEEPVCNLNAREIYHVGSMESDDDKFPRWCPLGDGIKVVKEEGSRDLKEGSVNG